VRDSTIAVLEKLTFRNCQPNLAFDLGSLENSYPCSNWLGDWKLWRQKRSPPTLASIQPLYTSDNNINAKVQNNIWIKN
jgi:hypothetical protein